MVKPVDPGALLQMLNRHIDDAESTR
jgi:hypothetical protein